MLCCLTGGMSVIIIIIINASHASVWWGYEQTLTNAGLLHRGDAEQSNAAAQNCASIQASHTEGEVERERERERGRERGRGGILEKLNEVLHC